ncbi:MAG TPA: hypothetical protein DDW49_11530 [Deltaproteobacteria bacterium]|nr:MAG: hypothetical protein A2048_05775 [Deltaproteobacteria bacterium GWA2_45_12]HBF13998.1 hypothetical protein [Deltaproteobacteria bacterium]
MKNKFQNVFLFFLVLLVSSCGSTSTQTADIGQNLDQIDLNSGAEFVFFFATEFGSSSGQLLLADSNNIGLFVNSGVEQLGAEANIKLFDGLLYVLHGGGDPQSPSSNNIRVLDPQNNFGTQSEFSTGDGTNPQDFVVIDNLAYISLYNPEKDAGDKDANGNPGDVIVMNLDNGQVVKRLSFFNFLFNDGFKRALAHKMVLVGNLLYVCIQDYGTNNAANILLQNAPGKIGVIDTTTNSIVGVISLQGRNPVDIVYSENENKLFVALQAPFSGFGNDYPHVPYGGVEIIPLNDTNHTILIHDNDLGGYVERLDFGFEKVFIVASNFDANTFEFTSAILTMAEEGEAAGDAVSLIPESSDLRDIGVDSRRRLWIGRRTIQSGDQASNPRVDVYDIDTGNLVGSNTNIEVPVTSIAIGQL